MSRTTRIALGPFLVLAAAILSGCGSSGSTTTAPATVARCAITLNSASQVPAAGGSGTLTVTATRECAWSASVEGSWLSIRSGASGQGEGTVEFGAAANPDPQTRTGAVVVNGTRAQISQAAGECVITLDRSSSDFPTAGGSANVQVRASSSLCSWTAVTSDDWISIGSGASGTGNGSVTLSVAPTTGPPRAGSVTIAGQQHSVTQSQGCTYALDTTTHATSAAGGAIGVSVTTAAACPWTAASNVPWIAVSPASGSGPGPATLTIAATPGPQRTGTVVIAGQLVTITQSPGCSYSVEPEARSVAATGGTASVRVTTAAACPWTAESHAPWITIQGATSGVGPADVTFSAAPTDGAARTGTVSVAGRTVTVTQAQGCEYTLSPDRRSVPASGGSGTVAVATAAGCAWTATSSAPWLTITSGASGTGSGEVQFAVAATSGGARSATLTIGGKTFTVEQGQSCSYALSASGASVGNEGGQRSFEVQTADGCAWTASSSVPWISVTAGSSGSGTGTVSFTVAPNSGQDRTGTITAGGQTFTVTQSSGCTFSLAPGSRQIPASGATTTVAVTAPASCAWTAVANVPWIAVTAGGSGTGNGTVQMTVAVNDGAPRSGTVTVAGQTFTVTQEGGCTFGASPENPSAPASGGSIRVQVTASAGCTWTAASNTPWIAVPPNAGATGSGQVDLTVTANSGPARTGTATVAGRTITVTQESGCIIVLNPTSQTFPGSAGKGTITVTAPAGCAWTAVSSIGWLTVTSGASGSGNGTVEFTINSNPSGHLRTATITIGGQVFTVTQQ